MQETGAAKLGKGTNNRAIWQRTVVRTTPVRLPTQAPPVRCPRIRRTTSWGAAQRVTVQSMRLLVVECLLCVLCVPRLPTSSPGRRRRPQRLATAGTDARHPRVTSALPRDESAPGPRTRRWTAAPRHRRAGRATPNRCPPREARLDVPRTRPPLARRPRNRAQRGAAAPWLPRRRVLVFSLVCWRGARTRLAVVRSRACGAPKSIGRLRNTARPNGADRPRRDLVRRDERTPAPKARTLSHPRVARMERNRLSYRGAGAKPSGSRRRAS